MNLFRSLRGRKPTAARKPTSFRPSFLALEARDVPALIGIPAVDPSGNLVVRTDAGSDTITLRDNGAGNVSGTFNGLNLNYSGVRNIIMVDDGAPAAGRNTVSYTANTIAPVNTFAYIGSGVNAAIDVVNVTVNGLTAGRRMDVVLFGQAGSDILNVAVNGRYQANSTLAISAQGGLGWDSVGVNAWTGTRTMDFGSRMDVRLAANSMNPDIADNSDNQVSFWYLGQMNGTVTFDLAGSTRDDWVSANLWFNNGSIGTVGTGRQEDARVRSGAGNDDVSYLVRGDESGRMTFQNPIVDGGTHDPNGRLQGDVRGDRLFIALSPPPRFSFIIPPSGFEAIRRI